MVWVLVVVIVLAAAAGAWHRGWFPARRRPDPERPTLADRGAAPLPDPAEVRYNETRRHPGGWPGV